MTEARRCVTLVPDDRKKAWNVLVPLLEVLCTCCHAGKFPLGCHDTQHNETQYNDNTQLKATQDSDT
jgi:hypothetical protein